MVYLRYKVRKLQAIHISLMVCVFCLFADKVQAQRKKKFRTSRNIEITANKSSKISVATASATDISITAPKAKVTVNQPKITPVTELWFKANGQLFSNAPETIYPGEKLVSKVALDELFWHSRINSTLASWFNTLENLKKFPEQNTFITYKITETELNRLKEEMAYKIAQFINNSNYLNLDLKSYYTEKLKLLGINTDTAPNMDALAPVLETLFKPDYTIEYYFYDDKKVRINKNGSIFCAEDEDSFSFKPCDEKKSIGMYTSDEIVVPLNCYEIRYELRIANNLNKVIVSWANTMLTKFPSTYVDIVKDVIKKIDLVYIEKLDLLATDVKKLSKNPLDPSVELDQQLLFTDDGLEFTKLIKDRLNTDNLREWILRWLWLTIGSPKVNPFEQGVLVSVGSQGKVSPQDKALYQIFETMVNKGAIKINELNALDSEFKNIPRIKAALENEATQVPNEPQQQDRFLYQGLLKPNAGQEKKGKIYMRHIDLANNNTIMGSKPEKEITENDRMYILVENKQVSQKLISNFETVAIGPEDSRLTNLLKETNTAADKFDEAASESAFVDSVQASRLGKATRLVHDGAKLLKQITILKTLSQLPTLPLLYEQDQTPDWVTYNVVHDYLYEAPVTAKYSVKQVNVDNTEKELVNGSYRINKLYRFRLKAGLVYSFLRKTDYTEKALNQYTVDNSDFGIDGTVGVQAFFNPQDIRSNKASYRPFVYVGLSMKKISENFYIGLGSEPFNGITLGINAHIGKREALVGNVNTATSIKSTWTIRMAPMILIDPSLFVRLFTFNNTNRSLLNL